MTRNQYRLARNLLFRLDAELAHDVSLGSLRWLEKLRLLGLITPKAPASQPVECMGLTFPNCVGLAAGLDKQGRCIDALGRLGFGHVEIGTITPRPQPGNPQPRLFRIIPEEAIINRMGFNNSGIEVGAANVAASSTFRKNGGIVGFNIGKNKDTPNEQATEDYLACLRGAWDVADYIAVNLSSPNTPGLRDLQAADCHRPAHRGAENRTRTTHPRPADAESPSRLKSPPTSRPSTSPISPRSSSTAASTA